MIRFDNWTIEHDGEVIAQQFDNKTRSITVAGDIPSDWTWDLLVGVDDNLDIIPLAVADGALRVVLTSEQVSIAGYYRMQLKATRGELVRHTNLLDGIYIPRSLSGDKQWPTIPSEFTELERRVKADADRAEKAAEQAENAGGGGGGVDGEDGGYYAPHVTQPSTDTMQVSFTPSKNGMEIVAPVTVHLSAGPAGADGKDGAQGPAGPAGADGYTPQRGVDYYTEADKTEMVNAVLAALPVYNGEVEAV